MSLTTPESVWNLQRSLAEKAKGNPAFRFYALYDKVYRTDVLHLAWQRCKANDGSPGVDQQTCAEVEAYGVSRWLGELASELQSKQYEPRPVRRVYIEKPDGKLRPLGIPCLRDRVIQMAAVLILEPIFETDFPDEQYGYRPERSAQDAVQKVHYWLQQGHGRVVDADLSGYFDSIPHHELLKSVARRVSDGAMLKLIRQWLEMPVEETDARGRKTRTTINKDSGRGTPQGAPISPLLANLYMRRFILGWKKLGWEKRLGARIVNYADDFVILCRGSAEEARRHMQEIMRRLKLQVNEQKTKTCRVPEESFDFLGYTIGRQYSAKTGRSYLGTRPSQKRVARFCEHISLMLSPTTTYRSVEDTVRELNQKLRGWANYFCLGAVSKAYGVVQRHTCYRLCQWLRRKHKTGRGGRSQFDRTYMFDTLGLLAIHTVRTNRPWAKSAVS
jgi:group II intron reverse transcriptase/maturase